MNESGLSRQSVYQKGSGLPLGRVDLVRTLRDLDSIELDCNKRPTELELLRSSLQHKLPAEILAIHEKLIAEGRRSIAPRFANACTECSGEVVVAGDAKRIAGMFVQCPHCGTLLYG
jgi:predicted  nucleic acid-binding Zn-ribbon protein